MSSRRRRESENIEEWVPKTRLGKMIQEGKVTSIEEVFLSGLKISEPQIVDALLPDLQEEVINVNLVQKQTDAGERSQFKTTIVIGSPGYIGIGEGKTALSHRVVYELTYGEIPEGMCVLHKCDNRKCVNPKVTLP